MTKDLELTKIQVQSYLSLRQKYEEQRYRIYNKYHLSNEEPNHQYHLSEESLRIEVRQLNISFRDKLIKVINKDKYIKYLKFKDSFNKSDKLNIKESSFEVEF